MSIYREICETLANDFAYSLGETCHVESLPTPSAMLDAIVDPASYPFCLVRTGSKQYGIHGAQSVVEINIILGAEVKGSPDELNARVDAIGLYFQSLQGGVLQTANHSAHLAGDVSAAEPVSYGDLWQVIITLSFFIGTVQNRAHVL